VDSLSLVAENFLSSFEKMLVEAVDLSFLTSLLFSASECFKMFLFCADLTRFLSSFEFVESTWSVTNPTEAGNLPFF